MKSRNIGWGVLFVIAGVIWLLINLDYIRWWAILDSLAVLWPLVFVVIGANIIFRKNAIVSTIMWILFAAVLIGYGIYIQEGDYVEKTNGERNILVEKLAETDRGELELVVGGLNIQVDSGSSNLVEGEFSDPHMRQSLSYKNGKKTAEVKISNPRTKIFTIRDFDRSVKDGRLLLNKEVEWELDVKAGAVNGTIDLSDLKVEDFDMDVGAGNLKVIFGSNTKLTKVDIDAGASKIELVVPDSAGVRIKVDGLLSKEDLENLGWNRDGSYYLSPNYGEADNKIDIDVDMGVGKMEVEVQKTAV